MNDDMIKYCKCMEEIKKRTHAITTILNKKYSTAYQATNREFCCLQIRKILELIALASIAANKTEYAKQYNKFFSHWKAKKILEDIEKINPQFYPVPSKQVIDNTTGKVSELILIESGFLTKEEFPYVYDKCSEVIHSSNPYGSLVNLDEFDNLVPEWNAKIIKLLNHHQIQLIDSHLQLWVLMKSKDDGKVHVSLMHNLTKNEP
ncbi:MAG: hypothetical protein CVU62_03030 [Deltaproteobacteria bacterium HGW-Deltaproteobacteria-2]|nr:MAG: hypothetical protein CVU62_03030 [Deltaproteobacteria bacterium HGW-Deltaproteobacteria-2]